MDHGWSMELYTAECTSIMQQQTVLSRAEGALPCIFWYCSSLNQHVFPSAHWIWSLRLFQFFFSFVCQCLFVTAYVFQSKCFTICRQWLQKCAQPTHTLTHHLPTLTFNRAEPLYCMRDLADSLIKPELFSVFVGLQGVTKKFKYILIINDSKLHF